MLKRIASAIVRNESVPRTEIKKLISDLEASCMDCRNEIDKISRIISRSKIDDQVFANLTAEAQEKHTKYRATLFTDRASWSGRLIAYRITIDKLRKL